MQTILHCGLGKVFPFATFHAYLDITHRTALINKKEKLVEVERQRENTQPHYLYMFNKSNKIKWQN